MKIRIEMILTCLLLLSILVTDIQASDQDSVLIDYLTELMECFPGEYDDHQQAYHETVEGLTSYERHRQTHHIFDPFHMDLLSGRSIYARQSQHDDRSDIYRQRVYSFSINPGQPAIQLTIYTPHELEQLMDGRLNPVIFKPSKHTDLYLKLACEVCWVNKQGVFNAYLKKNACNYYAARFESQVYLHDTLKMRQFAPLLEDRATDENRDLAFEVADKGSTINLKLKPCQ